MRDWSAKNQKDSYRESRGSTVNIGSPSQKIASQAPANLALGAAGELLFASRIALVGYQVYRPLADDRGVDLIVDVGAGRHVMVQVKAIRSSSSYVFMRKSTFPLERWVALGLVVFDHSLDLDPELFLIPASEWANPSGPLTERDYEGLKSAPEYGLHVRKNWKDELARWRATPDHVAEVLNAARVVL